MPFGLVDASPCLVLLVSGNADGMCTTFRYPRRYLADCRPRTERLHSRVHQISFTALLSVAVFTSHVLAAPSDINSTLPDRESIDLVKAAIAVEVASCPRTIPKDQTSISIGSHMGVCREFAASRATPLSRTCKSALAFGAASRTASGVVVPFRADAAAPTGEVLFELSSYLDAESALLDFRFRIDFGDDDRSLVGVGAQLLVTTINEHVLETRQYMSWLELRGRGDVPIHLRSRPTMIAEQFGADYHTEAGINTHRVTAIGLKLDFARRLRLGKSAIGTLTIESAIVTKASPTTADHLQEQIREQEKRRIAFATKEWRDEIRCAKQPASERGFDDAPLNQEAMAGDSSSVRVIQLGKGGRRFFEAQFALDSSSLNKDKLQAFVTLPLRRRINLDGQTLRSYCSASPALQGVLARPNRLRWILQDTHGNRVEGPAPSISDGTTADGSPWIPVELSPTNLAPMPMGFSEPSFVPTVDKLEFAFYVSRGAEKLTRLPGTVEGTVICTLPEIGPTNTSRRDYSDIRLVNGVQEKFYRDLDALAEETWKHGRIGLVTVLFDFYTWNSSEYRQFRTWNYDSLAQLRRVTRNWAEGEHPEWVLDRRHQDAMVENAVRPLIRHLLALNTKYPGTVRAIELANEPDNAEGIITATNFPLAAAFLARLTAVAQEEIDRAESLGMIRHVDTTIGFRRAEDYWRFWEPLVKKWPRRPSVTQVHYYDDFSERGGISLLTNRPTQISQLSGLHTSSFLSALGTQKLLVGEAQGEGPPEENDKVGAYLTHGLRSGLRGVAFWQLKNIDQDDDGFRVDLGSLNRWWATSNCSAFAEWTGVNLAWLNYGRDFGQDAYEPDHYGISSSRSRLWLRSLLEKLDVPSGCQAILRVFVGTDWRTGLEFVERQRTKKATLVRGRK